MRKPRNWKPEEIQVLPKERRDEYFGTDTSKWKFAKEGGLSLDEQKAIAPILKSYKFTDVYAVPEVAYPEKINVPDLVIDGVKVEVKKIHTKKSIDGQLRKAYKQTDGNVVILDANNYSDKMESIGDVIQTLQRRRMSGYVIRDESIINGFITKKKDSATASHKGANDSESFYTSIIPHDSPKIKSILQPKAKEIIANSGKSQKYWQERATQKLLDSEKESQVVINRLHRIYSEARKRTVQNILDMHKAYYNQNGWDTIKLNQLEPTGNIAKFYKMLEKEGLLTSLPERFRGRITREMALNAQLWAESAKIGLSQEKLQTALNQRIYTSAYSGTIKDVKGNTAFGSLDTQTVSQVMKSKFYGKNFSERIWKNSDVLANSLQERLSRSFITGQSYSKTASEIANAFNTSESNAMRLVRTEGNYFHNKGNIDAYTEMGYKKLKFSAVLDTRTSEVCQAHNNKIYDIDKIVQGDNAPPLHPNCRSIMLAVIGTNKDIDIYTEPEEEVPQEKPRMMPAKTNNEQPTIHYYAGKVLGNREDLRRVVEYS